MLTALIILLALAAVAFLVFKKKDDGKEVSREEFAADIRKFIDGTATALDWDDFVTFSLRDTELESLRQQCLDALLEPKSKKVKPWLSDGALHTLNSVISRLAREPIQPPQTTTGSGAPGRV